MLFLCAALTVCAAGAPPQSPGGLWRRVDVVPAAKRAMPAWVRPDKFTTFECDLPALRQKLARAPRESSARARAAPLIVHLPAPSGGYARYRIVEAPIMHPDLAARLPHIKTFMGQGIDDPAATVRLDYTPKGFHAQVLSPSGACYIDPYSRNDTSLYACYFKRDYRAVARQFECLTAGRAPAPNAKRGMRNTSNGGTLRIFRLACAATGEYTAFHGGTAALGQAAIVTAINRVTGIYETELSIRLILVANNISVVYTNAGTDPYSNSSSGTIVGENQANLDSVIGSANYDIGHVFRTGSGGYAPGLVCNAGSKARATTGQAIPIGDPFYVDYVVHEIGHQFNANHCFNGSGGNCGSAQWGPSAYEPGSGSTIMAYAGICGSDNLQSNSDPCFHFVSLDEISTYVTFGSGTCSSNTATGNNVPVANAGGNFTIPQDTPFELTASATDGDGDTLSYNWEEMDLGPQQALADPQNTTSPLFRSWTPTTNPVRTFPRLQDLLNNTAPTGERLPTLSRTLNFRVTARDNVAGGGAFDMDEMVVTVDATTGPFRVTAPNAAVTLFGMQTVTWNVAGTTGGSVNATNVNIMLSTNGGASFDIVLASNTPNDGTHSVALPNIETGTARVKIQGAGNIFFDISDVDFTIELADDLTIVPAGGLLSAGFEGGPFNPACLTYQVSSGGGGITWTALNSQAWVDVAPRGGAIAPGATTLVSVCISSLATSLDPGTHNDTVIFSNHASQVAQDRAVMLEVIAYTSIIEAVTATLITETCIPTNNAFDPDEMVIAAFSLRNTGTRPTSNLVATLQAFGGITLPGVPHAYGVVQTSGAAVARSFTFTPTGICAGQVTARLSLQDGALDLGIIDFPIVLGGSLGGTEEFSYSGPPVAIPDDDVSGVDLSIVVSNLSGTITDLDFKIGGETCTGTDNGINHTWVGDLIITLTSPQSTTVTLMDRPGSGFSGSSGADFCQATLDDDGGGASIQSIGDTGPFSGTFTPDQALSAFDGEDPNGTWTVNIADAYPNDSGDARDVSICVAQDAVSCCTGTVQFVDLAVEKSDSQDPLTNGNAITYMITVSNVGAAIATGVVVTDSLPASVTFSIAGSSAGCSESGGTVTCPVGLLVPMAATTVVVAVNVSTSTVGVITNHATAGGAQADPNLLNNVVFETTTIQDTDGDGSPDFHDLDDDNDGVSDADELAAGSDPLDRFSIFRISGLDAVSGQAILTWSSASGRLYTVWCSTNLLNTNVWQVVVSNIVAVPPLNLYTTSPSTTLPRFYFLSVE